MQNSFTTALRLLTRLPFAGEDSRDTRMILSFFPVVGACLGVLSWLVSEFLLRATSPLAAAFLCALLLPPLFWWLTEGRNLTGVIWCAGNWRIPDADAEMDGRYRPYWVIVVVQTVFLCRVVAIGVLVYTGHGLWLAAVPIVAMAVHAELLASQALGAEERIGVGLHWVVALVGCVLIGGLSGQGGLAAGILAPVLAWIVGPILARLVENRCGGISSDHGHGAVREVVEILALIVGIIALPSVF